MHVYWKNFNCVKIAMLPKAIYRGNTLPVKISMIFFFFNQTRANNLKIHMEPQKSQIIKVILRTTKLKD